MSLRQDIAARPATTAVRLPPALLVAIFARLSSNARPATRRSKTSSGTAAKKSAIRRSTINSASGAMRPAQCACRAIRPATSTRPTPSAFPVRKRAGAMSATTSASRVIKRATATSVTPSASPASKPAGETSATRPAKSCPRLATRTSATPSAAPARRRNTSTSAAASGRPSANVSPAR
ncbi:MAG: hypothetical protein FD138_1303 [Planctomycetota bacterium]|nr:MAG: hypothetical protein FD138_1303 [Planctomycetota bacterium]